MPCPLPILRILCEILRVGLLQIRQSVGSSDRTFAVADHLHNLPDLIANYDPAKLRFYWEVERPLFRQSLPENGRHAFDELWDQLAHHLDDLSDRTAIRIGSHDATTGPPKAGQLFVG